MAVSPREGTPMGEEHDKGRRRWPWVTLTLLVLYVLSVGPATMVVDRTEAGEEVYMVVYTPLGWLHGTPLQEPLSRYIEPWADGRGERSEPPARSVAPPAVADPLSAHRGQPTQRSRSGAARPPT